MRQDPDDWCGDLDNFYDYLDNQELLEKEIEFYLRTQSAVEVASTIYDEYIYESGCIP